jgi:hypothetical protein
MAKYTPEEIDAVIDQFKDLMKQFGDAEENHNKSEWHKKFDERFSPYSDKLKALNGDDFDVVEEAYNEHKSDYSDLSDDEYADALEENIKKTIERIWPEAPDEVKEEVAETVAEAATDGEEGKVEAHIEAEEGDAEPEVHVVEEKTDESDDEDKTTSDMRTKRAAKMKSSWTGSPHTSGGRNGTVSDENCKEEPTEAPAYDRLDAEKPVEKSEEETEMDELNKAYDRLKNDSNFKKTH